MYLLSPSKLSVIDACPRCFWDSYKDDGGKEKVPRPRGIFPSLPGGIDLRLKEYFDHYRGSMPPELIGALPGRLFSDIESLAKWRHWRTGLTVVDSRKDFKLIGAIDDCLEDGALLTVLDYKTKGSEPKTDGSEYYQTQLDCYDLMLQRNGHHTSGEAVLLYVWPTEVQNCTLFEFDFKVCKIPTSAKRAEEIIDKAIATLVGKRPPPSPTCEYCNYAIGWNRLEQGEGMK